MQGPLNQTVRRLARALRLYLNQGAFLKPLPSVAQFSLWDSKRFEGPDTPLQYDFREASRVLIHQFLRDYSRRSLFHHRPVLFQGDSP